MVVSGADTETRGIWNALASLGTPGATPSWKSSGLGVPHWYRT